LHHSQLAVGAGSPTALKFVNRLNKPAPTRLRFTVEWGRVYEIVNFRQLLLVNPPLQDLELYSRSPFTQTRYPSSSDLTGGRPEITINPTDSRLIRG
jgi:hypothetical protein